MRIKINDDFSVKDDRGYSWMLIHTTRGISPKTGEVGAGQHRTWHPSAESAYESAINKGLLESDAESFLELAELVKRLHADFVLKLDEIQAILDANPKLRARNKRKIAIPEERTIDLAP